MGNEPGRYGTRLTNLAQGDQACIVRSRTSDLSECSDGHRPYQGQQNLLFAGRRQFWAESIARTLQACRICSYLRRVRECDAEHPADPGSRDECGCLLEDVHEAVCHTQLMLGRAPRARERTRHNRQPRARRNAIGNTAVPTAPAMSVFVRSTISSPYHVACSGG